MKHKLTIFLAAAALAVLSGTAAARDHVNFSLSIGVPAYSYGYVPPPVYYPPRVYYAPPPVYYAPPSVYYAPAPWVYRNHRDWDRHQRHDQRHGNGHR